MLHYFDRASMAHSLEVRVPFLDHELVEYCATIPSDLKVRRLQTKQILKDVARGVVPDRIIDKPKIGFFSGAVDGWFSRKQIAPSMDTCFSQIRVTTSSSTGMRLKGWLENIQQTQLTRMSSCCSPYSCSRYGSRASFLALSPNQRTRAPTSCRRSIE